MSCKDFPIFANRKVSMHKIRRDLEPFSDPKEPLDADGGWGAQPSSPISDTAKPRKPALLL
eukprot:scaffold35456_cov20-Tisochrysis_lutea.AAC.3